MSRSAASRSAMMPTRSSKLSAARSGGGALLLEGLGHAGEAERAPLGQAPSAVESAEAVAAYD